MMALRLRTCLFLAFGLLVLLFYYLEDDSLYESTSHTVDVLKDVDTNQHPLVDPPADGAQLSKTASSSAEPKDRSTSRVAASESTTSSVYPEATNAATEGLTLQGQFDREYDALGLEDSAGAIYGNTLKHLAGSHAGFHSGTLTPTQSWTSYSNTPPYTYNPYPEYNTEAWKADNVGEYVPCDGPDGAIREVQVFSGHLEPFKEPILGSHLLLDIDSNLCFERMTRLGAYGYQDEESISEGGENAAEQRANWDKVNWRQLQEACVARNVNRFVPAEETTQESPIAPAETSSAPAEIPSPPPIVYGTGDVRRATTVDAQAEVPEVNAQMKKRTAVLLRSTSGKNYTDNDLQNIRSLVTELALRTGGEYTVYLLVAAINDDRPLWSDASEETSRANVPKEFQDMAIIWNQAMMEKFYPKSEDEDKFHPSEWRPVQRFAHDYPQYEFFWNLDLDYRYTGHHYDLLEKLAAFAKAQPRKGLWERNERFYIPSVHGSYDFKFRATVEQNSGSQTVWGAPTVEGVTPVGPVPLVMDPTDDDYTWGVGDDADYISLAPIFNPVNTHWPARDDIWGYAGAEGTPRRATVGMNSRCSKKLLQTMDAENLRGNHIGSEMGPPTVALLHGLKAVFAPIPIYFDRAWPGSSLDEFLNPGLKGVSGGVVESPFSQGREFALEGATWSAQSLVPKRLYFNWMGWEYEGIGGPEWENIHGRTCLPPILLHPIEDVVKPLPDHSSKS